MTIVEFLLARLNEREVGIREALRTEDYGVSQFDLDDIESKRRIIAWCGERDQIYVGTLADDPDLPAAKDFVPGHLAHRDGGPVLRMLAELYADHPDYQEEWKT